MATPSTVIQFSVQRMVCSGCGVEANANCTCGVAYTPKIVKAAEAIKANPQKSDRAIAEEIGVSQPTVSKARKESGDNNLSPNEPADQSTPDKRVGRDGKSYPSTQKKHTRGPRFIAPEENQHDRDFRALLGMWECTCESARAEFLETIS